MKRSNASVPILILFALMLCSCGSGDSSASEAPSKAAFVKWAAAICEELKQEFSKKLRVYVRTHPGSLNIHPEIARDRLIMALDRPLIEEEAEKLAALPAPQGDEEEIAAIVKAIEAGVKKAMANPTATILGTYRPANKLLEGYELRECAVL
jgi:hypothetical protein